jgi:formiminotetrahydrofolate cyclodeaminase
VLTDLTVQQLLERIGSGEPVPGGGSVAALAGSLAASLTQMVARLTIGRGGDAAIEQRMSDLQEQASSLRESLTLSIDRDSEAYAAVLAAFRMAKGTDEERKARAAAVQEAFKEAARVPLSVAEMGTAVMGLAEIAITEGNKNAATDGLVGALMARAAVFGAAANVRINLASIADVAFKDVMAEKVSRLEKEATLREGRIMAAAAPIIEGTGK